MKIALSPYAVRLSAQSCFARWVVEATFVLLATAAFAEPLKISGSMQPSGNVTDSWLSPNGQYAVFIADRETPGVFDLWSATTAGGPPVKLTSFALSGNGVRAEDVRITNDSARVVFVAQMGSNVEPSIWTIPITGGTATLLSTGGTPVLQNIKVNADGSRVLYRQSDGATPARLRSVATTGGAISTLSPVPLGAGPVGLHEFTPDGLTAVYQCICVSATASELFKVPASGGASAALSGTVVASATGVDGFRLAPDGSRVVFHGKLSSATRLRLYSTPLGGAATRTTLSDTASTMQIADINRYAISPNSARAVYIMTELSTPGIGDYLYSVPIAGGASTLLNNTGNGLLGNINDWTIAPNSQRVLWLGTEPQISTADQCASVFSAPIAAANGRTKLAGDAQNRDGYSAWQLRVTPDSQTIVFSGTLSDPTLVTLYSVPVAGGATQSLIGDGRVASDVPSAGENDAGNERFREEFRLTQDGSRVIYRGDYPGAPFPEAQHALWSVPVGGGSALLLSGGYEVSKIVSFFGISQNPANDLVTFRSRRSSPDNIELFVTSGISTNRSTLDVDGNNMVTAVTDGVLLTRWLLGFRGSALTTGALGSGATRNAAQINTYLNGLLGASGL